MSYWVRGVKSRCSIDCCITAYAAFYVYDCSYGGWTANIILISFLEDFIWAQSLWSSSYSSSYSFFLICFFALYLIDRHIYAYICCIFIYTAYACYAYACSYGGWAANQVIITYSSFIYAIYLMTTFLLFFYQWVR